MTGTKIDCVVLDIDGTLVDSVYAHVWIWHTVFRAVGVEVPSWRIHRAIGMGGDRLVEEVAGARVEDRLGDEIREQHDLRFDKVLPRLTMTRGAVDLLESLSMREVRVVLASSANRSSTVQMMDLLGAEVRVDAWVCGDDVGSSKPAGESISLAVDKVSGRHAVVIGDTVWDAYAARDAGHLSVGVLSGGISQGDLVDAGAIRVLDDPGAVCVELDAILENS